MAARAVLALAVAAVLLGAPATASAATNNLAALPPAPSAGTTSTTFVLRAAFDGRFDATAVTAQVAGRTLGMSLVAGTATSGTWSVSTTLPAGTWQPTFTAAVSQGNTPSATGAPVVVTSPAPPPPPSPPPPPPPAPVSAPAGPVSSPEREGDDGGGGGGTAQPTSGASIASPQPAPAGAPVPGGVPAPAAPSGGGDPETGGGTATPADATPRDAEDTDEPSSQTAAGEPGAPTASRPAAAPNATAGASGGSNGAVAVGGEVREDPPRVDGQPALRPDGWPSAWLIGGSVALAGVALAGMMLLLARRRARRDPAAVTAARGLPPRSGPEAVTAALRARSVRKARTRFDEDPIVAALGIDDEASARRARVRAARANRDPGEPQARR